MRKIRRWWTSRRPIYNYPPMTDWAARLTRLTMDRWVRMGVRMWR